jgi:multicomponent Na+:H+ antiporter subunit D
MAMTAALCVAIGVFPGLLYQVLPFPTSYQPYTASHIVETVQLLAFTAVAFFLLRGWLRSGEKITLDTDWVYRRGARPAYAIGVAAPGWLFTQSDRVAAAFVRRLARIAGNPAGYLVDLQRFVARATDGAMRESSVLPAFDPDHYRPPVAAVILLILAVFAALASLNFWGVTPR